MSYFFLLTLDFIEIKIARLVSFSMLSILISQFLFNFKHHILLEAIDRLLNWSVNTTEKVNNFG